MTQRKPISITITTKIKQEYYRTQELKSFKYVNLITLTAAEEHSKQAGERQWMLGLEKQVELLSGSWVLGIC